MEHSDINEARANVRDATDFVNAFIHEDTLEFKKVPTPEDIKTLMNACDYIKAEGASWQYTHYSMIQDRLRHIELKNY